MTNFNDLRGSIDKFLAFKENGLLDRALESRSRVIKAAEPWSNERADNITAEAIDDMIKAQAAVWSDAATTQIEAQQFYLGEELGQGGNKCSHSLEVASGMVHAYKKLADYAGIEISEEELSLVRNRGMLHDGGLIWNLSDEELNKPREEFEGKSARSFVEDVAWKLHEEHGDKLGSIEEIRDAICFEAVSDKKGPIFKAAKAIDKNLIDTVRNFFKHPYFHGAMDIGGLHTMSSHHNSPDLLGDVFNGADVHGAIDHLGIVIDWTCGATGDAKSIDELVLCVLNAAKNKEMDQSYARFVLEGYGSGESILEKFYSECVNEGFARIPAGMYRVDAENFVHGLQVPDYGSQHFPQLLGWNPPTDSVKDQMVSGLNEAGSVAGYVAAELEHFPQLSPEKARVDIAVTNTTLIGNDRPLKTKQGSGFDKGRGGPKR